jgi:DNA (cytosine-5)-methyltransferase 1
MLRAIEFFAGSGLVRVGLESEFETVWANDNCPKKRDTYVANHGDRAFHLGDIENVTGTEIPLADLAWASFPCQDLSLAGNMSGMGTGTRSGLFWEWVRILWELRESGKLPSVLAVENVVGFLVADDGKHLSDAYFALRELGYKVGAVEINASVYVPQSRPRAFLIAIRDGVDVSGFVQSTPTAPFHTSAVIRASRRVSDPDWVWWSIPYENVKRLTFSDICERQAPCDPPEKTKRLNKMLSQANRKKLASVRELGTYFAGTAYRRTRPDEHGVSQQRLEIRFDGLAGCLRTPNGGSSRQTVVIVDETGVRSRLLTVRECARLMGAPDSFVLPGSYNDAYRAMGDGVAVPVTRLLSRSLLHPLARRVRGLDSKAIMKVTRHPRLFQVGKDHLRVEQFA